MKKLYLGFLVFIFCFCLSGCSLTDTESDRRFMVSALGFSAEKATVTVDAEVIIINSENAESDPRPQVISATADNIDSALKTISLSLAKPLLLEHCGVIAIGDQMTADWFDEICDYCFENNRITLSAFMISCKNPKELLGGEPSSSVAVGYDIMGIIEQNKKSGDLELRNRFFEVESLRQQGKTEFYIPRFEKSKDTLTLNGSVLFKNGKPAGGMKNDRA